MLKFLSITLLLVAFNVSAEFEFNKPNIQLLDEAKQPVPNSAGSTDLTYCLQKASKLSDGIYYCRQPDIKVTITTAPNSNTTVISWVAPTHYTDNTLIKTGDIDNFKIYINEDVIMVDGDSASYETNLEAGEYIINVGAVVNMIESTKSNTVIKVVI